MRKTRMAAKIYTTRMVMVSHPRKRKDRLPFAMSPTMKRVDMIMAAKSIMRVAGLIEL